MKKLLIISLFLISGNSFAQIIRANQGDSLETIEHGGTHAGNVPDARLNLGIDPVLLAYQSAGSAIKGQTLGLDLTRITVSMGQGSGTLTFDPIWIYSDATVTGVKWFQNVGGVYTASNNSRIGLYQDSAGVRILRASCANDGSLWKSTTGTWGSKSFITSYAAHRGLYYIGYIYCSSAETTKPNLGFSTAPSNQGIWTMDFTLSRKVGHATLTGQTDIPTSIPDASLNTSTFGCGYFMIY